MQYLVSMAADLNAVKSHINLRGQKLHLSSVVTPQSHTALEKYRDPVLFSACLKKIFIEVSSFHSVCSMSNIKGAACQTVPLHLESTVTEKSCSIFCKCVRGGPVHNLCRHCILLGCVKNLITKTMSGCTSFITVYLGTLKLWITGYEYQWCKSPSINDKWKRIWSNKACCYERRKQVRTTSAHC